MNFSLQYTVRTCVLLERTLVLFDGIVREFVAFEVMTSRKGCRADVASVSRLVRVNGGVLLEVRLRSKALATRDTHVRCCKYKQT